MNTILPSFLRFFSFLVLLLLLPSHPAHAVAGADPDLPDLPALHDMESVSALREAVKAYEDGKYQKAARIFESYLRSNPDTALVQYMLGATYLETGKFRQAQTLLSRALRKLKDKPEVFLGLAKSLIMQKKYSEALAPLEKYISLRPTDTSVLEALGSIYYSLNRLDKAEITYRHVAEAHPESAESWFSYAAILSKNRKTSDALDAFLRVRSIDPTYPEIDLYIGLLSYELNRFDIAEESLKRVLAASPGAADINGALGTIAAKRKQYPQSESYFKRALALNPSNKSILQNLAAILVEQKKYDDAISLIRDALKRWKNDPALTFSLATLLTEKEQYAEARELLASHIKRNPRDADATLFLAQLYEQGMDIDKTISTYKTYMTLKSDDFKSRMKYATILRRKELYEDALREYNTVIRQAPDNLDAWSEAGNMLEKLGRLPDAKKHYAKMSAAFQNVAAPEARLGYIAENEGNESAAALHFDIALSRPLIDDNGIFIHRAKLFDKTGESVQSEMNFRKGLERLLERSQKLYDELMNSLQKSGGQLDLNRLMELGEKEKGLEKNLDDALVGVTKPYLERNDFDGALSYLTSLMERYRKNKKLIRRVLSLEREKGNIDRVMRLSEELLNVDVRDTDGHLWMAWAQESRGNLREAGLAYRRAVESDPNREEAYSGLLNSYRQQNHLADLLPYLERKAEKLPDNQLISKSISEIRSETASDK